MELLTEFSENIMSQCPETVQILHNLVLPLDATRQEACFHAKKLLGLPPDTPAEVCRQSLDARRKGSIRRVFSVALTTDLADPRLVPRKHHTFNPGNVTAPKHPFVVGMGPAGLFCGYLLSLYGLCPILIDRGQCVEVRTDDVQRFREGGELDEDSNVSFGEGGAGTFSDGKLVTRINDPRTEEVLRILTECGAPEEIRIEAKPHVGTDELKKVIVSLRRKIEQNGGTFRYGTRLEALEITNGKLTGAVLNGVREKVHSLVLATGNAARDVYRMLMASPARLVAKPFSVGFRMEHLQQDINHVLYGNDADRLPPADYAFSAHYPDGDAYTFCMCPGGEVINASCERGGLVTNGMSNHARAGRNANAALLAGVSFASPQEGIDFQRALEQASFRLAGGPVPVTLQKHLQNGTVPHAFGKIRPTVCPDTVFADFQDIFPSRILAVLRHGLSDFSRRILNDDDAVLSAPETHTSAPLRVLRDAETLQATGIAGLYPCGEGAGYAGGITSSAADGLRVAEKILTNP